MKEEEMDIIAEFIKRVIIDKVPPTIVKKDVLSFRKPYQKVHFCFENETQAYKYIKIS
jgi:glycine hydroxymethyltransferase